MVEDKEKKISSVLKRFVSGIILIALIFTAIFLGGDILFYFSMTISIIGLIELYRVFQFTNSKLSYIGYVFTILYYYTIKTFKATGILLFLILFLIGLLTYYVVTYPKFNIKEISLIIFSILYVAVLFSFVYLLRVHMGNYGKYLVWLVFISSWGCDTFAYCIGMLFGNHKFLPNLSPKKSIEGAIGGIIGSGLLGILYVYITFNKMAPDLFISYVRVFLSCILGAIISQLGDLTASAIKRDYNVKDYGDIIPGHGGILDRFDSVIFTAPVFYFLLSVYV